MYYVGAFAFAVMLPYESMVTPFVRVVATVLSLLLIRYRDQITSVIFGGATPESKWIIFVPLTLYFVIVFGGLWRIEQSIKFWELAPVS